MTGLYEQNGSVKPVKHVFVAQDRPLRMMSGELVTWPDVDLSTSPWPGDGPAVNFLSSDFNFKGEHFILVRAASLEAHDPPDEDPFYARAIHTVVVFLSHVKFDTLVHSWRQLGESGSLQPHCCFRIFSAL